MRFETLSKADKTEHWLFLTGKLAYAALNRTLDELGRAQALPFGWRVHELGVSVAALMTADMIGRRLKAPELAGVDRIIVPGRCRGDLAALSLQLGVPVERGPDELRDLPQHFGRKANPVDLRQYRCKIFAEIVDAPQLSIAAIVARAQRYRADGADVIDVGCLPNTAFAHLADSVRALKADGFVVSVDSMAESELRAAAGAGADYLLSLREDSLSLLDDCAATPVLVPQQAGDLPSLLRAIEHCERRGRAYLADPILDPIHFGFTESIVRYRELRRLKPHAPIMMGVGNLTELTHADTAGMNALLFGIISELDVDAVLTTEVSPHARSAVREADWARRIMHAAKRGDSLPRYLSDQLMSLHERSPFPEAANDIRATAELIRDPNFRIQISDEGIFVYNRDGVRLHQDPFEFWPELGVNNDAGHAFYLGVELARAQIAWQLGKRYTQDEALRWGAAIAPQVANTLEQKTMGTTLSHRIRGLDEPKE